jgi:hypothetical protein
MTRPGEQHRARVVKPYSVADIAAQTSPCPGSDLCRRVTYMGEDVFCKFCGQQLSRDVLARMIAGRT